MCEPLIPRALAASIQIQMALSIVIAPEPGSKETRVKLLNTVEQHNFTLTLKHIDISKIEFASNLNKLNSYDSHDY